MFKKPPHTKQSQAFKLEVRSIRAPLRELRKEKEANRRMAFASFYFLFLFRSQDL